MFDRITASKEVQDVRPVVTRSFPKMTLTVDETAEELNVSRPTAYELVRQEGFPAFRIGQRILVSREGLQRWIDARCAECPSA